MTGPSSAPSGERAGTRGARWGTELRRVEVVVTDGQPEPRPNRATRRAAGRRGRPHLTEEQQALADDLHLRAMTIRAASDGGLSITEAVHLAAAQLGLEAPQTGQGAS